MRQRLGGTYLARCRGSENIRISNLRPGRGRFSCVSPSGLTLLVVRGGFIRYQCQSRDLDFGVSQRLHGRSFLSFRTWFFSARLDSGKLLETEIQAWARIDFSSQRVALRGKSCEPFAALFVSVVRPILSLSFSLSTALSWHPGWVSRRRCFCHWRLLRRNLLPEPLPPVTGRLVGWQAGICATTGRNLT